MLVYVWFKNDELKTVKSSPELSKLAKFGAEVVMESSLKNGPSRELLIRELW